MSQHSHLYWNTRWRKKRAALLSAEPLCRMCRKEGRITEATVADHIIPHKGNVEAFWSNSLQPLCKPCHDSAKAREEAGRPKAAIGQDGWPIG